MTATLNGSSHSSSRRAWQPEFANQRPLLEMARRGQQAVGVAFFDVDGPLLEIDYGIARLFQSLVGEQFKDAQEAKAGYAKWEARHQRSVKRVLRHNPAAHKEQVFMELLFWASLPGNPLHGLTPRHIGEAATDVFFPGFMESIKHQGIQTFRETGGNGCQVVALNSCGYRPILQAALAGLENDPDLRREPGLCILINANDTHPNNPLKLQGSLVNPPAKGAWLASTTDALVEHFGMPDGALSAWGDGATDDRMLTQALVRGGTGHIVDIEVKDRVRTTAYAVWNCLLDAMPGMTAEHAADIYSNLGVVVGNDWESGTFGRPSRLDAQGFPTIGESYARESERFRVAWRERDLCHIVPAQERTVADSGGLSIVA